MQPCGMCRGFNKRPRVGPRSFRGGNAAQPAHDKRCLYDPPKIPRMVRSHQRETLRKELSTLSID